MDHKYASFDEQSRRCDLVCRLTAAYTLAKFSPDGEWMGEKIENSFREDLYFCIAYLRSGRKDAVAMANAILKKASYAHCHFAPMVAIQILLKYSHLLQPEGLNRLKGYVEMELDGFAGPDLDFVGVNDNFPSMATFILLAGGEMLHRPEIYEKGEERLHQFKALLERRGVATEYNSPTYTPIQLLAMSEIANLVKDPYIQDTARKCEERLWADLLGHLHKETSQVAGPFSRAYTVNSTGHTGLASCSLYALLGEQLTVNLVNTLFESEKGQEGECVHLGAVSSQVSAAWFLDTSYLCPHHILELALKKEYPYEFIASTEFSSSTDAAPTEEIRDPYLDNDTYEYPSGNGRITTYMTSDYALGTATNEFHNGVQTDSFHILYRSRIPAVLQKDIKTVYARYIVNENAPDMSNYSLEDEGRKIVIQEKNSALVLYKPKITKRLGASSLKLSIVMPAHSGMPDEIWLGGNKLENGCGESVEPCSVYIKDGPVYMAFHPLILTDYGRKASVRIKKQNGFLVISFYNYEGEQRDFAARGFLLTGNGFAAEVGCESEAGSFTAFRKLAARFETSDVLHSSVHSRQTYNRKVKYSRDGLILECEYSPASEGIKLMAVNGKALGQPKLQITGFDTGILPYM